MSRNPDTPEIRVWPITGRNATMLDAIASALTVMRASLPAPGLLPTSLDLAAAEDLVLRPLALATAALVEELMADMVAAPSGPVPASARPESAALGALRELLDASPIRMRRKRHDEALGDAVEIIREIGLERYDLECYLGIGPTGDHVIASAPVAPASAHAWLFGRLFDRAESFVLTDERLATERDASAWYFNRWSGATTRVAYDREAMEFTRTVREQEWSLVTRDTLLFEEPVMMSLIGDEAFADTPPRQQHLARALQRSVVDAFEVTAVDGTVMTVRSSRGDTVYRVHEHNTEANPIPGLLLLGRLTPLDDDLWLRSPGALMYMPGDGSQLPILAEGLDRMSETMPTPIALEAFISTVVYGAKVPTARKPAESTKVARAMLDAFYENMKELGLTEAIPADQAPFAILGDPLAAGTELVGLPLDQAMAEWTSALLAQAMPAASAQRGAATSSHRGGKRAKKQKSKRRK